MDEDEKVETTGETAEAEPAAKLDDDLEPEGDDADEITGGRRNVLN